MYSKLANTAVRLLQRFGQEAELQTTMTEEYDPETGTASKTVSSEKRRIFFDLFKEGETTLEGELIQKGDRRAYMDAIGLLPVVEDIIVAGGVEYSIAAIKAHNPAGTPVLYELHVRTDF